MVDVVDFVNANRKTPDQIAVHEGLFGVLQTAFVEAGIDFDSCVVEDRGDGALILVPSSVSKSQLADLLPDRLMAELRRYNSAKLPAARFKLRIGLHAGETRKNEHGWVGRALNDAYRIVDAGDAKMALAESESLLAVIASEFFFREVIEQDPEAAPDSYRQIDVAGKAHLSKAWLRVPGVDVIARPKISIEASVRHIDDVGRMVLGTIPLEELEDLRGWLDGTTVEILPVLASRAAGPAIPTPIVRSAWELFKYFADFNAGPDGIPPALAFLDLWAAEVGGDVGARASAWVQKHARRLRLVTEDEEVVVYTSGNDGTSVRDAVVELLDATGFVITTSQSPERGSWIQHLRVKSRSPDASKDLSAAVTAAVTNELTSNVVGHVIQSETIASLHQGHDISVQVHPAEMTREERVANAIARLMEACLGHDEVVVYMPPVLVVKIGPKILAWEPTEEERRAIDNNPKLLHCANDLLTTMADITH
jgi:hypothetical protein